MTMQRLLKLFACGLLLASSACLAQSAYPNRPLKLIVPLAAGGATTPVVLRRAVVAGHRAAARQVGSRRPELALG